MVKGGGKVGAGEVESRMVRCCWLLGRGKEPRELDRATLCRFGDDDDGIVILLFLRETRRLQRGVERE